MEENRKEEQEVVDGDEEGKEKIEENFNIFISSPRRNRLGGCGLDSSGSR
jgi:hypothetical protein